MEVLLYSFLRNISTNIQVNVKNYFHLTVKNLLGGFYGNFLRLKTSYALADKKPMWILPEGWHSCIMTRRSIKNRRWNMLINKAL